jgi:uncharacterized phage-associated protein
MQITASSGSAIIQGDGLKLSVKSGRVVVVGRTIYHSPGAEFVAQLPAPWWWAWVQTRIRRSITAEILESDLPPKNDDFGTPDLPLSYPSRMPSVPAFDADKAVEAIAYAVSRTQSDLYTTLKLLYLADKLHLERYGRLIFGDWYAAMDHGPVPSHSYDILKFVRGDRPVSLAQHAREVLRVDATNSIEVLREPDLDELSATDIECLDDAFEKYSSLGFGELKRLTHDDAYNATPRNAEIALEAIASMLKNAPELIQHLSNPHPDRQ